MKFSLKISPCPILKVRKRRPYIDRRSSWSTAAQLISYTRRTPTMVISPIWLQGLCKLYGRRNKRTNYNNHRTLVSFFLSFLRNYVIFFLKWRWKMWPFKKNWFFIRLHHPLSMLECQRKKAIQKRKRENGRWIMNSMSMDQARDYEL